MQNISQSGEPEKLRDAVVKGMLNKKGLDIVSLQLSKIPGPVCDYFVICHGTNKNQVEAIADAVQDEVALEFHYKPWHKEGVENAEWILLDYVDVVVHIFLEDTRRFYNLEKLWADAESLKFESI
ncbi:MAG: ribosome silencing factor [Bacteroidales bacterium]|nr:ribosome silencing factor [Bacteroidales bacterium]